MCGITGFLTQNKKLKSFDFKEVINEMTKKLNHRGPNNSGFYCNETFAFGHTRLSIRDLSTTGNQPMTSQNGRFVIIYNGEIYNENILKKKINISLKSQSDTEIILECIAEIGFCETIKLMDGMFALAVYDNFEKKLFLSRDRSGIKPLYWSKQDNFIFSSEIKSFYKFSNFKKEIDLNGLSQYLQYGFIDHPKTIFKNVNQLLPGFIITVDKNLEISQKKYSNFSNLNSKNYFSTKQENEIINDLEIILNESVRSSLISDVEVGAFLSGGIDSSLISYLMQKNSNKKIKTFCLFSKDLMTSEASEAKKIAEFIGSEHYTYELSQEDIDFYFANIIDDYDEPFSDSSNINTFFVSKKAKEHVNVVLSGDGGDELFGGYSRYIGCKNDLDKKNSTIMFIKKLIAQSIINSPKILISNIEGLTGKKNLFEVSNRFIEKSKFYQDEASFYYQKISTNTNVNQITNFNTYENKPLNYQKISEELQENFMLADLQSFLPSRILTKVDRESMRNSLEVRIPFLNNDVINFALDLPIKYKIRNNEKKYVLKQLLLKYFGPELIKKSKMGFGLRKRDILLKSIFKHVQKEFEDKQNIELAMINYEYVKKIWFQFQSNKYEKDGDKCWNLFIYLKWFKKNFN